MLKDGTKRLESLNFLLRTFPEDLDFSWREMLEEGRWGQKRVTQKEVNKFLWGYSVLALEDTMAH